MPHLYLASIYIISRFAVLRGTADQIIVMDVLALNWLCSTLADMAVGYPNNVAAYLCIDMTSALWLSLRVKGKSAGIAEVFYIALIFFNVAFFFRHAFTPWTHWVGLSVISWGQLLAVAGGILRHDLAKVAGHLASVNWLRGRVAIRKREAKR